MCACECISLKLLSDPGLYLLIHRCAKEIFSRLQFDSRPNSLYKIYLQDNVPPPPFSFSKQLSLSQYIIYLHSLSIFFPPVTPLAVNLCSYLYLVFCKSSVSARASPQVLLHASSPCLLPHRSLIHSPSSAIHLSSSALQLCLFYSIFLH